MAKKEASEAQSGSGQKPTVRKRQVKKSETVREKAAKASAAPPKTRRLKKTASKVGRPIKAARRIGAKEYYLPMPNNRVGTFMNKRRSAMPGFLRNAWAELRQVVWPDRRNTTKLTIAVFVFAIIFALLIAVVDYGLDKIFKALLLS